MTRAATAPPVIRLLTVMAVSALKPTIQGDAARKTAPRKASPAAPSAIGEADAASYRLLSSIRSGMRSHVCLVGHGGSLPF